MIILKIPTKLAESFEKFGEILRYLVNLTGISQRFLHLLPGGETRECSRDIGLRINTYPVG